MSSLRDFYDRKPTSILYHYTDAAGFIGIITNRGLWATHIRFLNDSREFRRANKIASDYATERLGVVSDPEEKITLEYILNQLKVMPGNTFVVSLSQRRDLLSQWRGYCPRGGFSLGFNPSRLIEIAGRQRFVFVQCSYNRGEQKNLIRELIDSAVTTFKTWPERSNEPKMNGDAHRFCGIWFFPKMLRLGSAIKDPAFREEEEWRLIGGLYKPHDPVLFRPKGPLVIPYQIFAFGDDVKVSDLLSEVIVGPSPEQKLARAGAERFLLSRVFGEGWVQVNKSDAPYRTPT